MTSHGSSGEPDNLAERSSPPSARPGSRTAGVTVPLFSLRTARDFGIGEIGDLPSFAEWARATGLSMVQLLPSFELARGETSPYGARTAFGIDPIYVSIADVPELDDRTLASALGPAGASELERLRALPTVDYAGVRALKDRVLDAALDNFVARELGRDTDRGRAFRAFVEASRDWEDDLALYDAIRDEHDEHGWSTWPHALKHREAHAIAEARARLERPILAHQYRQFLANEQWAAARARLRQIGVELMGDLPFIVGSESADVWSHPHEFRSEVSLGAPPDAYSADGQDWGLPAYDFEHMEQSGFSWLKMRTQRARDLYDRFRIDHVVGYFRQWVKPKGAKRGAFDVASERMQHARGRALLETLRGVAGEGAIIAEDLGVIPPWVRTTLTDLGIPGYKIIPWEREHFHYRDPKHFPWLSVASFSTHDTPPIELWWKEMEEEERRGLSHVLHVAAHAKGDELFEAHMRTLFHSGSGLALLLVQEVLGDDVRINTPGTVGPENWSYRLGMTIERLGTDAKTVQRTDRIRALLGEARR